MPDDELLFGGDEPDETSPTPALEPPSGLPDWRVSQLRSLLNELGIQGMDERQDAVSAAAGRRVASLRELTPAEATSVAEQLGQRKSAGAATSDRSAWDDREEDTWIDRL